MNLRNPPFFTVNDFEKFDDWQQLDEADKVRIITGVSKRIQRTKNLIKQKIDMFRVWTLTICT